MEIRIFLEISIIFLGICLFIVVGIFLTSIIFKNQRILKIISPFIDWFNNKNISLGELVQPMTSILALLIAIYALTVDSIRDNESSKRYSESVKNEKEQHSEIMKVYKKQTNLIEKYSISSDSMLGMLKKQAKVADMQFENQIVLTQPGINFNFSIQDTNKTLLIYDDKEWIMPEVIFKMYNFGGRTADKVSLDVQIISPKTKCINRFNKIDNLYVLPKATLNEYYFPVIALEDKNFFLVAIDVTWTDAFNSNKVFKERLYNKFIRETNGFYTSGKAEKVYVELINQIIHNPFKVITNDPQIRNYMYKTYNK